MTPKRLEQARAPLLQALGALRVKMTIVEARLSAADTPAALLAAIADAERSLQPFAVNLGLTRRTLHLETVRTR